VRHRANGVAFEDCLVELLFEVIGIFKLTGMETHIFNFLENNKKEKEWFRKGGKLVVLGCFRSAQNSWGV